jgi:TPR repeat protein
LGTDPRRPPAGKRRIFAAAAAIAAAVLVVVGAYRFAWLPVTPEPGVAVNQQLRDRTPDDIPNSTLARETSRKTGAPLSADAIADMVQRGQGLIASGKILAARSVLKEAADANNAEAALALGMTYDPAELDRLGIRDIAPEADAARRWYEKARDLGSAEAQGRLDRMAAREGHAH